MGGLLALFVKVRVRPDCESLSMPGEKAVLSDPITKEMVPNPSDFFEEILGIMQEPFNPQDALWVKDIEREETSDGLSVKVILDGEILHMFGIQDHKEDPTSHWYCIQANHEELTIRNRQKNPDGSYQMTSHANLLVNRETEGSFRVECWHVGPDGTRNAGPELAGLIEWVYVNPVLHWRFDQTQKVVLEANKPASAGNDRSVFCHSMAKYFDDADDLIDFIINHEKQDALNSKGTIEYDNEDGTEMDLTILFADMVRPFIQIGDISAAKKADGESEKGATEGEVEEQPKFSLAEAVIKKKIQFSREGKSIDQQVYINDRLMMKYLFRFHEEPLRVEFWSERPSGYRGAGPFEALLLKAMMERMVEEKTVNKEVAGLDERNFYF